MAAFLIVLILAAAIVLLFFIVVNIRAILARRKRTAKDEPRKNVSAEKQTEYAERLRSLIQLKTVADGAHEAEFEAFREELKRLFPLLHERAEIKTFHGCLIYKISGTNPAKNVMLMSHHDVVAADGDWKHPPFEGVIADGALWGRGTVDTKTPLFSELSAVEELLSEGFSFDGINLYIGSSANEEICGDGIPLAVEYFKENGIRFDVVSDEGGAIVQGMMPGVARKSAMVAVHEKGRHTFTCTAETTDKGHLGLNPVKSNVIDRMSAFITDAKNAKITKPDFYPEVRAMFERHAPYMNYPMRLLFSNIGIFRKLLLKILPKASAQVEGMLKTNFYFTRIKGGTSPQIQAKTVTTTAFFRCVREETLEKELKAFQKIADRYGVEITPELVDYCRPFSEHSEQFRLLESVLNENFPDVIVSPFLLTAGTDARHFTDIADCILRFAPIDLSKQQFASVHNPDENISVENIGECVAFYKSYIRKLCAGSDKAATFIKAISAN